jgi:inhibitor of the pro-sigma K processing machinery
MNMGIKWWIMAGAGGMILFMLLSRSAWRPLKWIWYGVLYTAVGAVVLFLFNLVGEWMHFRIPINPMTAFITGVLGLPGLLYLVIVKGFLLGG